MRNLQLDRHPNSQFYGHHILDLRKVMRESGGILNLNTMTHTAQWLQEEAVNIVEQAFAPLSAFITGFTPAEIQPKTKNRIKVVLDGSTTQSDPTDFQPAVGSNITDVEAVIEHLNQPWPESNADRHGGVRAVDMFAANVTESQKTVMARIGALLTTANFTKTVTCAPGAFGLSDAGDAYGQIAGANKALLLNSAAFGRLAHASATGLVSGEAKHGWKNGIHEVGYGLDTGDPKVIGVALAPRAIAVVSGLLAQSTSPAIRRHLIGVKGTNLMMEHNQWFNPKDRSLWNSLDLVFSAVKVDGDAAVLFKTP